MTMSLFSSAGRQMKMLLRPFAAAATAVSKRSICSANLTIERNTDKSRFEKMPKKEDLVFGTTMSDHMLMIEFDTKLYGDKGWSDPKIVPYQDLKLSPAACSLHFGIQCFEGMKAYKSVGKDTQDLLMFRPDMNMKRLSSSMERIAMPGYDFDHKELITCIEELVKLDQKYIPYGEGYSLYIRPTAIGTHKFLGLAPPETVLLYVITSPVGPYYKTGFKPVRLTADTPYIRAWPGGTGNVKVGGNYAPAMKPQIQAGKDGYQQIMWLFGENDEITEVGAMNVFFFLINKETNRPELVTAPLTRGDILPGVTRDSILHLARQWGDFDVSERFATMPEIAEAAAEGRLIEAFGAGTAAIVSPIEAIQYKGNDIDVPAVGEVTKRVSDQITGIQYGKMEGPDGWSVKIGEAERMSQVC